jgi:ferric-dicitrate binding protein FerR (iron transport regulator)
MTMDTEALYERWRDSRSRVEPAADFADRIMQAIHEEPPANHAPATDVIVSQPVPERSRAVQLARAGAVAAAVLAALFRVVELVSVFATTGIEN